MADFELAIGPLLENEGHGYVDEDHGRGASKWGITLETYRGNHPGATADDIRNLTGEQAEWFYRSAFWDRYHIGEIEDQALANKVLDLAVNMGPGTAIRNLQVSVGVRPDGILGKDTAAAVNKADAAEVLGKVRAHAEGYYRNLAATHPEDQHELAGWLARLAKG